MQKTQSHQNVSFFLLVGLVVRKYGYEVDV